MSKKSLHVKRLDEQMKVREQLLKYSELNTLAMAKVLGKLKDTVNDDDKSKGAQASLIQPTRDCSKFCVNLVKF